MLRRFVAVIGAAVALAACGSKAGPSPADRSVPVSASVAAPAAVSSKEATSVVAAEQPSSTVTVVAEVVVESSAVEVGNDTTAPVAPVNGSANAPLSPQQAISEADAAIAEADAALAEV